MKKLITLLLLVFSSSIICSQTFEEIINNTQKNYANKGDFKVSMTYKLYRGVDNKDLFDDYKGVMIKKNKNLYVKINNTETVTTNKFYVKINHDEKAILYSATNKENTIEQQIDLKLLLELFDKGKMLDKGDVWECEFISKVFSQTPYSKVVLVINKEDYTLKKQIFYYAALVDFSKTRGITDYDIARLEIQYNDFLKVSSLDDPYFIKSNYIKSINKKPVPVGKYKKYEVIHTTL